MIKATRLLMLMTALLVGLCCPALAQNTGSIAGEVRDEKQAVITGATVTLKNIQTNETRTTQTNSDGRYHFASVPVGAYEITVESTGFAKYQQSGITLALESERRSRRHHETWRGAGSGERRRKCVDIEYLDARSRHALRRETSGGTAPRHNSQRLQRRAFRPRRKPVESGQTAFAGGTNFSSNGGRTRSNNFMIDGQDNNNFGVAGSTIPLNNPDAIQEVRLVTNQFSAEYGRNSSAVFNAITRSGTNDYHGSGFWFHNDNALNACSNTQKAGTNGFCNPNACRSIASQGAVPS